ncbi:MAG: glucose-6-phosphate isomerase [Sandaracinaceae bacterium]
MSDPTHSPAWAALSAHADATRDIHLRTLFADDPKRADRHTMKACDLVFDFSKHRVVDETIDLLVQLAEERELPAWIEKMFNGEKINTTEDRAVLHVALRNRQNRAIRVDGRNVVSVVSACLAKMRAFTERVRAGEHKGATGEKITDVVHLGIGGSDLGPRLVCEALRPDLTGMRVHFVSNVDVAQLAQTLEGLAPEKTLFIVASKSFGTQETLTNATTARAWAQQKLTGQGAIAQHFVAVTTNVAAAKEFGIDPANCFEMWDWVGGRYSLWSAIGLPIALGLGMDGFEALLAGAHAMDHHFMSAPLRENVPVRSALLGVYYSAFYGCASWAVLPYDHLLRSLPFWLQQGDMESNGKGTRRDGARIVGYDTGPIVWGGTGTDAQHSFFQLLHQGTRLVPVELIGAVNGRYGENLDPKGEHHAILLANMLAQAEALMIGKGEAEVRAELEKAGMEEDAIAALLPHKVFLGNRPSTTVILPKVEAKTLGALLAYYEHRIFVQGIVFGVNSFDQWGVELGKKLAGALLSELDGGASGEHDASTAKLLDLVRHHPS